MMKTSSSSTRGQVKPSPGRGWRENGSASPRGHIWAGLAMSIAAALNYNYNYCNLHWPDSSATFRDPGVSPSRNASFPLCPLYLQYYIKEKQFQSCFSCWILNGERHSSTVKSGSERASRFISLQTALQLKIAEHLSHLQAFLTISDFQEFLWILVPSSSPESGSRMWERGWAEAAAAVLGHNAALSDPRDGVHGKLRPKHQRLPVLHHL